ncbi:MAG: hypothetical protein EZS28_052255, partial [Streblomastix strix]
MQGKHEIEIEVYDQDSLTKNDLIGVANIDILPTLNNETQIELFLQPQKDKKEDQTKSYETESNSDKKLGKVSFSMFYISEQDWIKNFEKEQVRKKKEEEEFIKQKELEEKRRTAEEQERLDEERRIAEEKRKQKEALDAQYIK